MLINQTDFEKLLSHGNITVSAAQYEKFYDYSKLLVEWNEKINLTAITDPDGIALKHFMTAFILLPLLTSIKVHLLSTLEQAPDFHHAL